MKALILDIKENEAVVLDMEGNYRIIPDEEYEIGQSVELPKEDKIIEFPKRKKRLYRNIAASIVLFFAVGLSSVVVPSSSVRTSGNSSLTYEMNIWNRVIRIKGNDKEGREIAKKIDISHPFSGRPIDDVIEETFDIMEKRGGNKEMEKMEFHHERPFFGEDKGMEEYMHQFEKKWEERMEKRNPQGEGNPPSDIPPENHQEVPPPPRP